MTVIDRVHEQLWRNHATAVAADQLESTVHDLVAAELPLATRVDREETAAQVIARVRGLGPLHSLAGDPDVSEIMVNAGRDVWVERKGLLFRTDLVLSPDTTLELARRLAARVGRRIDRTHPAVDIRLEDGSRLHAIVPPLAIDGPSMTIRRFPRHRPPLEGFADPEAVEILRVAVEQRDTVVIAGATSAGKTSLLNAMAALIPPTERVVTIEEAAELHLTGKHVVRLETMLGHEGAESIGVRELVRHALRMRPDRIICGEMRGPEALDLIQAMNTGHRGSLSTVHANSPEETLRRIETMMLIGDADLPLTAIRDQLDSCLDLIVMMRRGLDGVRVVHELAEVVGGGGSSRTRPLWRRT